MPMLKSIDFGLSPIEPSNMSTFTNNYMPRIEQLALFTGSKNQLNFTNNTLTSLSEIEIDTEGGILFEANILPALTLLKMSANLT